jgi:5-methylcytosine-specific restriction endonuclease McrA
MDALKQKRAYHRAWSARNRDKISAYARKRYKRDKAKLNAASKAYAQRRPDIILKAVLTYQSKNPHKRAAIYAGYRAAKKQARPAWACSKYIELFYFLAREESSTRDSRIHVDHIVPLQSALVCGLHNEFNLQLLPGRLNSAKGNRVWPDMPV